VRKGPISWGGRENRGKTGRRKNEGRRRCDSIRLLQRELRPEGLIESGKKRLGSWRGQRSATLSNSFLTWQNWGRVSYIRNARKAVTFGETSQKTERRGPYLAAGRGISDVFSMRPGRHLHSSCKTLQGESSSRPNSEKLEIDQKGTEKHGSSWGEDSRVVVHEQKNTKKRVGISGMGYKKKGKTWTLEGDTG